MNSAVCLLERAAARFPDRIAAEDQQGSLSYRQLRARCRAAAEGLLQRGLSDRPVLVYLPKSLGMLTAMLAVLYSGRAYVPADTAAPAARLRRILANLKPSAIVTDETLLRKAEELQAEGVPVLTLEDLSKTEPKHLVEPALSAVTDADPIYVMYTSGSTGEPKGVTIAHRGVLNFARWSAETFRWDENTVIANQTPFYFDMSVMDIYGALYCGGRLIITPEVLFRYPSKLPEFLRDKGVTSIFWVPTVMIRVAASGVLSPGLLPELKSVCVAGEVMPNLQLNVWRRALPGAVFANLYGPTETTVICVGYVVDRPFHDAEPLPIGRPLPNLRVLLLDEEDRPAREGELCVSGSGVTLGYFGRPDLTERAFVTLDLGGTPRRFYRTGDLGRYNDRGEILFLGRKDGQIKLHGNRVELGEVENAGRMVEGVENCCAIYDAPRERIVLFAEARGELEPRTVLRSMRRYVPAYMLPERVELLAELPYNRNRKIDRQALKKRLEEE